MFRVLLLTAIMVVTGLIVAAVGRSPKPEPHLDPLDAPVSHFHGEEAIPLQLTIQLSAPAASLSLRSLGARTDLIAPHRPDGLTVETRTAITINDGSATALLSIEWEAPSDHHFLRIVAEPDFHESKELILHAPVSMENHAITFDWPDLGDDAP